MAKNKKAPPSSSTVQTIIWVLRLVYRFSPRLLACLLISQLLATTVPFAEQKYLSHLIDSLVSSYNQKNSLWTNIFLIFFFIRLAKVFLFNLQHTFQRLLDFDFRNKLRKFYLSQTSRLDYQQFEDVKIANLMAKVNEEYQWRTRQIISDIFDLIVQIISFVTVIVLLLPNYWYLAILLFIGELPGLIVDRNYQKLDWRTFNHYNELSRPGWDAAWQLVDKKFIAELKINQAINWLKSKFTLINDEFTKVQISNRKSKYLPDLFSSTFSLTIGGLCMLVIFNDITKGLLSIGMFTFYFGIIRSTGDYFAGILNRFVSISEQALHINNFQTIVELPSVIKNGQKNTGLSQNPTIEFRNVSFHYPNKKKYIYKNLNLIINPGEEIAIVGPNGAGKSTLIKLLCRFYDPVAGQILINGTDLRQYNLSYWYRQLSLLTQEFNIYPNLDLKENVTIGKSGNNKEVVKALKKSEAHNFTQSYRHGLKTMMSQRYGGEEPSWGQWQKIAIARIFYRNTPIMILDEPTASIDAVAESKIFSRLYKNLNHKTLIIVSHRFSTVRNAQRILVVDKGKIVEQGSHQQLLAQNGLYAHSYRLQARGYQEK